ncbi:MAG: peptide methionine sulfoxide reductase [Magnetococcales bacterium]|nr:peptide methionine sulfoxide reductase [Magnetococcales bacterium]
MNLFSLREALPVLGRHHVTGRDIVPPFPDTMEMALFGMGCFWGAERCFWQQSGVHVTAVGYAGGTTPSPTYEDVCSGMTGHNEVVRVVFDPDRVSFGQLVGLFWASHDPTQGMRQGNDLGTQYRSGIYYADDRQKQIALATRASFQECLTKAGYGKITTEILPMPNFYYAEDYHQQYLAKNPSGYCGLGGTGVALDGTSVGGKIKTEHSPVRGMMRLLSGKSLDDCIIDPSNPNLIVRDD